MISGTMSLIQIAGHVWLLSTAAVILLAGSSTGQYISASSAQYGSFPTLQVDPKDFPAVPKQFTVRIEMILPDEKLVEEFLVYWDEELNLARFDYALGKLMPPFSTTRPTKTIHDFGNGVSFSMDGIGPNCSMSPLGYLLTDATVVAPLFRPRKYIATPSGNITVSQLLRALDPRQLFYLNESDRVHNSTRDTLRGIPCEVWTLIDNDFYIPGVGKSRVKHKLSFMTKEFTRVVLGDVPHMVPVQRITSFVDMRSSVNPPKIIFNFFDFTVPPVPTLFDFSISQCIPKAKTNTIFAAPEVRESIQIRFPGNFSGMRLDQFVPQFRRLAVQKLLAVGELSPLRVVGMFPSQDTNSVFITGTILPRPPPILLLTKVQENVKIALGDSRGYNSYGSPTLPADQTGLTLCGKLCFAAKDEACTKLAWCNTGTPGQRTCALRFQDAPQYSPRRLGDGLNLTCDIYQRIVNNSAYEGSVIDALFKVLEEVTDGNFNVTVAANGSTVSLSADDIRTDVSLTPDDTAAAPATADSRSSFELYRGQAIIAGRGAKDQFSKLSPAECRRRCLDEKRFTCHSVSTCVHGDCVISDMHGDELTNTTNGKPSLVAHTHCVVWTRSWKGMFSLFSFMIPVAPADMIITGVSNEDSCAKQCLFNKVLCESFSYCSTPSKSPPGKAKTECQLYTTHAFEIQQEKREPKEGCWHFSRNYVQDFESTPGYELLDMKQHDVKHTEIEPAFERWQCAKECIDRLGDDGCLAFDICETFSDGMSLSVEPDLPLEGTIGTVTCRISTSYVGVHANNTGKIRANENCTLYTRSTYLDGTLVNPKTVGASSIKHKFNDSLGLLLQQRKQLAPAKGYNISDMAGIAIGMLLVGTIVTAVCFALKNRPANPAGLGVGAIPFARFT